jgi:hypothetical protein
MMLWQWKKWKAEERKVTKSPKAEERKVDSDPAL